MSENRNSRKLRMLLRRKLIVRLDILPQIIMPRLLGRRSGINMLRGLGK